MKLFDAGNSRLSDAMFAEAYRATIPTLADATHVTVRACSARLAELSQNAQDISDVVELGEVIEKLNGQEVKRMRVVAVPVDVHVANGAAVIADESFDKHVVSFEVNGAPVVQIVNLALSTMEQRAEQAAKDAADKIAADAAKVSLDAKLSAAREQGKEEALLERAKKEGAASVQKPDEGPQAPPSVPPTGTVQ